MGLKELSGEMDLELMMEFRGTHYNKWVQFCEEKGYKAVVED